MNEEFIFGNVGVTNTSIGIGTLSNITTGIDNTAFGTNSLQYLSTGDGNSAFGINSISDPSGNPSFSSAFGTNALVALTTGLNNSAFGYQALAALTTGSNNSGFGSAVAPTLTTGSNNVLVGSNVDTQSSNITGLVGIGSGNIGVGTNAVGDSDDVLIGYGNRGGGSCIKIGSDSSRDDNSYATIHMGYHAGSSGQTLGRYADVVIGHEAMADPDPDYSPSYSETVCVGKHAGLNCEESFSDTILGYQANQYSSYSQLGVAIGTRANQIPLTPNAYSTSITMVGYEAGINSIFDNDNNDFKVIIGASAGNALVEEGRVTICGFESMYNAKGERNSTLGYRAMRGKLATNETNAAPGTAVGMNKFTSIATTTDGNQFVGEIVTMDGTGATPTGLDGTYFLISSLARDYYVWFNVDGISVDPMVASRTGIVVALTSGDSLFTILNNLKTALNNHNYNDFDAQTSSQVGIVDFTITAASISAGTAVGYLKLAYVSEPTAGTGRVDVGGAIAEALSKNYFLFSSGGTDYYTWFNRNGYDSDPGPSTPALLGKTGIQVSVSDSAAAPYVIAQNIYSALGAFTPSYPSNFLRIVMTRGATNNVVIGNNALNNSTLATFNVIIGSDTGQTLEDAQYNVIVGRSSDAGIGTLNVVVVGDGASTTVDNTIVLGVNASATASGAIAIGSGATAAVADLVQIGANAVSGAATMSFRTQVVSDESWIGGGTSRLTIDNNGNLVRTDTLSYTTITTDATATTMATWAIAINTARRIQTLITGRRTSGAGSTNDSGVYRLEAAVKNVGGVLSVSSVVEINLEDVGAWDVAVVASGTNAELQVTGAALTNINWEAQVKTFVV